MYQTLFRNPFLKRGQIFVRDHSLGISPVSIDCWKRWANTGPNSVASFFRTLGWSSSLEGYKPLRSLVTPSLETTISSMKGADLSRSGTWVCSFLLSFIGRSGSTLTVCHFLLHLLGALLYTAALSRLKIIWRDKNISLASKVKLMRTLILSTFLYACESWTLTAEIERRIQALEMRCYRRLLNISYKDHVTNEEVRNRIQNAIGVHDDLPTMVKKRKLRWYGHISRSSGMAKTILQGTVKGARRRGRQKKRWEDNIKEWMWMGFGDSLRAAEDWEGRKGTVATSSVVPRRPPRLRDWDEMRLYTYNFRIALKSTVLVFIILQLNCIFHDFSACQMSWIMRHQSCFFDLQKEVGHWK